MSTHLPVLPPSFCPAPWTAMQVDPAGHFRPCCYYAEPIRRADGAPFEARTASLREVWDSPDLARIRRAQVEGERLPGCERCWRVEDAGGHSKRHGFVATTASSLPDVAAGRAPLRSLELNLSNRCNLMCRTCSPAQSTALAAETRDLLAEGLRQAERGGDTAPWRELLAAPRGRDLLRPLPPDGAAAGDRADAATRLWADVEGLLPTLDRVDFLGGEPMLSEDCYQLLVRCRAAGLAGRVHVAFTINGTVGLGRWLELWRTFGRVTVSVSLDAVGPRFEYMRHPASWGRVSRHVRELRDAAREAPQIEVMVNATVGALNAYYLPELVAWANETGVPVAAFHVSGEMFDPRILPAAFKREVRARVEAIPGAGRDLRLALDGLLNLMDSADWSSEWLPVFRAVTAIVDGRRGQRLADVFPELAAAIGA